MNDRSLEEQRLEFAGRPLIATPIAGAIAWTIAGIAGYFLPVHYASLVLFISTGMIVYLGMFISRFTGENFLDKSKPKNTFDALFLLSCAMVFMFFAVAIPFFLVDRTSLPLSLGVMTGILWVPVTWIIRHWVGVAHALARIGLVVPAWYLWPQDRYVAIPAIVVGLYIAAIWVLLKRPRSRHPA